MKTASPVTQPSLMATSVATLSGALGRLLKKVISPSSCLQFYICICVGVCTRVHVRLQACSYFIAFICSFSHLLRLCNLPLQFCSVAQSCLILCDPMDCSKAGLPVHHQLQEFTQIHLHWIGDTIQPFYPLLSPSPAFNLSQHQGLNPMSQFFTSDSQVLEFQLQHQSFKWIFRTDIL